MRREPQRTAHSAQRCWCCASGRCWCALPSAPQRAASAPLRSTLHIQLMTPHPPGPSPPEARSKRRRLPATRAEAWAGAEHIRRCPKAGAGRERERQRQVYDTRQGAAKLSLSQGGDRRLQTCRSVEQIADADAARTPPRPGPAISGLLFPKHRTRRIRAHAATRAPVGSTGTMRGGCLQTAAVATAAETITRGGAANSRPRCCRRPTAAACTAGRCAARVIQPTEYL